MALVVDTTGRLQIRSVPAQPAAGADDVIVSILRAGICGTDLQMLDGTRPRETSILGHEGIARVVAIGSRVSTVQVGDVVVFNPTNPLNQHDILGHSTPGVFQQQLRISEAALVIADAARLPLTCGPLVEPLSTVIYSQSLAAHLRSPRSIAVVGGGSIGLLQILYARLSGVATTLLITRSRARLEWAIQRKIIDPDQGILSTAETARQILERTAGRGVDAVFLCTPRPGALDALRTALQYVRPSGCIDLFGGFADGDTLPELPGIDLNAIRRGNCGGIAQGLMVAPCTTTDGKRIYLTGHRGSSAEHMQQAAQLLSDHPEIFSRIISHVVSLPSAPHILDRMLQPREHRPYTGEIVKVIIDCTMDAPSIQPVNGVAVERERA